MLCPRAACACSLGYTANMGYEMIHDGLMKIGLFQFACPTCERDTHSGPTAYTFTLKSTLRLGFRPKK